MEGKIPITPQGLHNLKEQLKHIKTVERRKNIQDIETAREHGDLSENAEYQYAKEKQAQIAGQIQMLEDQIARADVIDPRKLGGSRVVFGATIEVYDHDQDRNITYQIVGPPEADSKNNKISVFSPLASAMIGKEVDDEVVVETPAGDRYLDIISLKFE